MKLPYYWSEEEIDFLKNHYPKKGSVYVSNILGRTRAAVKGKTKQLGLVFESKSAKYHGKSGQRHWMLMNRYGIGVDEYDKMFSEQSGVCAICGKGETAANQYGIKRLAVDHDHKTQQIRGLLCHKCNLMLGCSEDSIETLSAAVDYLNESTGIK